MGAAQAICAGWGVIVRLPFPAASLMPNRKNGKHWSATLAAKSAQHWTAHTETQAAKGAWKEPQGDIALSLLYLLPDKRHRDLDNLLAGSKALIDGMAKALGVDDKRFRPILIDTAPGPKGGALIAAIGVEIRSGVSLEWA